MKKFLTKYWYVIVTGFVLVAAIVGSIVVVSMLGDTTNIRTTSYGYFSYDNDLDAGQVKSSLTTNITNWKNSTNYTIEYQTKSYKIENLDILDFNADETYSRANRGSANNAIYFDKNVEALDAMYQEMVTMFGQDTVNGIDKSILEAKVLEQARKLTRTYEISLADGCLKDSVKNYTDGGWTHTLSNLNESDVEALDGKVIEIESGYFSLLEAYKRTYPKVETTDGQGNTVLEYDRKDLSYLALDFPRLSERLSIIGTGMAKVIQRTSFKAITIAQKDGYNVSYASGYNTDVLVYVSEANSSEDTNSYDFSFVNPEKYSFELSISRVSSTELKFTLYGYKYSDEFEIVTSSKVLDYTTVAENLEENNTFAALEDKTTYLDENGYIRTNGVDFVLRYSSAIFGEEVSEDEIRNDPTLSMITVYYKVLKEGKTGEQIDYYRRIVHPDGTTEITDQTIYTSSVFFFPVDETISYYMIMPTGA